MGRLHDDVYLARIDAATDQFAGLTARFYTGNVNATKGLAPTGTVLASMVVPSPSHAAAVLNAGNYEAVLAGAWQDISADASGTIGCVAFFQGSKLIYDGSAGTSGKDVTVSQATVTAGAAFSVTRFTLREPAIS